MNKEFNFIQELFKDENTKKIVVFIVAYIERVVSSDKEFYSKEEKKAQVKKDIINKLNTTDEFIYEFIDISINSPFGIFNDVFQLDIPDIIITNKNIKLQYSNTKYSDIKVPEIIQLQFQYLLSHFISLQQSLNDIKFDPLNAIQDTTYNDFRLNMMHSSLHIYNTPVVTVRKHVSGTKKNVDVEEYEKSLGVFDDELNFIKHLATFKSFIIFGDTGSGKTTLLRYLSNHNFDKKRNLVSIEDASELYLPSNLTFITNNNYNIKDLFTASLRQSPSHLVIGETRVSEIVDILEASLTFCTATTIHATSLPKAIERIYFMSRSRNISKQDIQDLISSTISMFIWMNNKKIENIWIRNDIQDGSIYNKYELLTNKNMKKIFD